MNNSIGLLDSIGNKGSEIRVDNAKYACKSKDQEQLKESCKDFESVLLNYMIAQMRKTVPETGFLNSSMGSKIFTDMMFEEIAMTIAKSGGIGLGDMLYESLSGQLEAEEARNAKDSFSDEEGKNGKSPLPDENELLLASAKIPLNQDTGFLGSNWPERSFSVSPKTTGDESEGSGFPGKLSNPYSVCRTATSVGIARDYNNEMILGFDKLR